MIKPELYKRTTDILYQAYFNDTLVHGCGCACAVGNIVAANMGFQLLGKGHALRWDREGLPIYDHWNNVVNLGEIIGDVYAEADEQIRATGYEVADILRIEAAFESAHWWLRPEDRMFLGLSNVLDVLAEIHQVTDQDLLTSNNKRFKEQYERRAVKI